MQLKYEIIRGPIIYYFQLFHFLNPSKEIKLLVLQ